MSRRVSQRIQIDRSSPLISYPFVLHIETTHPCSRCGPKRITLARQTIHWFKPCPHILPSPRFHFVVPPSSKHSSFVDSLPKAYYRPLLSSHSLHPIGTGPWIVSSYMPILRSGKEVRRTHGCCHRVDRTGGRDPDDSFRCEASIVWWEKWDELSVTANMWWGRGGYLGF